MSGKIETLFSRLGLSVSLFFPFFLSFLTFLSFLPFLPFKMSVQQINASNDIVASFRSGVRCALLNAQCQSGKTGAYQLTIKQMLNTGMVRRVYIVCGSAETELRQQARDDTLAANPEYYNVDNRTEEQSGAITVIFHQDFDKYELDIHDALIVADESHLVQTKGQKLHGFLGAKGVKQNGDPAALFANNAYLLSVDATPYAELAALYHKETPFPKAVINLEPGDSYFGLGDYKGNGSLLPTFNIAADPERFEALLLSVPHKWVLMRLTHGATADEQESELRAICAIRGFPVLLNTSVATDVAITRKQQEQFAKEGKVVLCLEDAPQTTTVVIVCGRLRAGKVVPKEHIGFVWEGAKNSKTDALVQGLPGRMCGYRFGETKPLIFVPPSALEENESKVVKASEFDRAIVGAPMMLPMKGMNLAGSRVAAAAVRSEDGVDVPVTQWHFSFLLPFRAVDEYDPIHDDAASLPRIGEECVLALRSQLTIIQDDVRLTDDARAEILNYVATKTAHVRRFKQSSQLNYYKQLLEADATGTAPSELISDCPEMTFCVTFPGFNGLHATDSAIRRIHVIFFTRASGRLDLANTNLKSRIPKTNGKSVFGRDDSTIAVATIRTAITPAQILTPVKLEATLDTLLTRWQDSLVTVAPMERVIRDEEGRFQFNKRTFHFTSVKRNDVEAVCRRLEAKFNIKIKNEYRRGAEKYFNISAITWEVVA